MPLAHRRYRHWQPCAPILAVMLAACGSRAETAAEAGPLIVYNAGSLARPLRAVLDSFAAITGVAYEQENAGSLETARKLTELGKVPDVIALADHEVFPQLLIPEHATWYARFARNRIGLAYTDESRYATEISPDNWWRVLLRPGVEIGRADPNLDPAGYRALMVMRLAELQYGEADLAQRLLAAAPERNVRPKEVDLVALVQAGQLDYVWQYESVARATGLRFLQLPHEIDLSAPEDSARYAQVAVRVLGQGVGDTIELRGSPIIYGFSIPSRAPHPEMARRFAAFVVSDGLGIMRQVHLPANDRIEVVGSGAPAELAADRPPR